MSRTTTILKLIAAIVIVSAILAPSASALYLDEPGSDQPSASQTYVPTAEPNSSSAASSGFDWGDAAVGAAGTLIVLSAAGVMTIRRSRGRAHTLATG